MLFLETRANRDRL